MGMKERIAEFAEEVRRFEEEITEEGIVLERRRANGERVSFREHRDDVAHLHNMQKELRLAQWYLWQAEKKRQA